jgi:hypothetical protein
MADQEIRVEALLSRRVRALNGRVIGRIEELRAERRGREMVVVEYLLGPVALLERLSMSMKALSLLRRFAGRRARRYRVSWRQMDLSDAERPCLRCSVEELEKWEP